MSFVTPELLVVRRRLDPVAQQGLASFVCEKTGVRDDSLSMKVLSNEQAGVTLLSEHTYGKALRDPWGKLKDLDPEEAQAVLQYNIDQVPEEASPVTAKVVETEARTTETAVVISYIISTPKLEIERQSDRIHDVLGRLTGRNVGHGNEATLSRLVLMVVPINYGGIRRLTEVTERARPANVSLVRTQVQTATEARGFSAD